MVIGHQKQLEFLARAKESGRLGHAYIFSGPDKVGKKTAALEWLSGMLGIKITPQSAHPDFVFVAPLVDPKTGQPAGEITVGQIRELIKRLSLTASMAKYKAAVIDDAHLMNVEAQNCLLKTLEEPPGNALIILVARDSRRLLATIRSRCEIVKFGFVAVKEMNEFAARIGNGFEENKTKEAAAASFGRPGRLALFIADEDNLLRWRQSEKEFAAVVDAELPEKFNYAKKITDDENSDIGEIIEIWQFHFRNRLLESLAAAQIKEVSKTDPAKNQFVFSKLKEPRFTPEKIAVILNKIHDLSVVLQTTNASPRLAIENFMLDL